MSKKELIKELKAIVYCIIFGSIISLFLWNCQQEDRLNTISQYTNKIIFPEKEIGNNILNDFKEGLEFECDEWEETGKTIYENSDNCEKYTLLSDGNWYTEEEMDSYILKKYNDSGLVYSKTFTDFYKMKDFSQKECNGQLWAYEPDNEWDFGFGMCDYDFDMYAEKKCGTFCQYGDYAEVNELLPIRRESKCIQKPIQEKVCIHEKIIGRKLR